MILTQIDGKLVEIFVKQQTLEPQPAPDVPGQMWFDFVGEVQIPKFKFCYDDGGRANENKKGQGNLCGKM